MRRQGSPITVCGPLLALEKIEFQQYAWEGPCGSRQFTNRETNFAVVPDPRVLEEKHFLAVSWLSYNRYGHRVALSLFRHLRLHNLSGSICRSSRHRNLLQVVHGRADHAHWILCVSATSRLRRLCKQSRMFCNQRLCLP